MATFKVAVVRVTVEPHPNANALELAHIGGYVSVALGFSRGRSRGRIKRLDNIRGHPLLSGGLFVHGDDAERFLAVYLPAQVAKRRNDRLCVLIGFGNPIQGAAIFFFHMSPFGIRFDDEECSSVRDVWL